MWSQFTLILNRHVSSNDENATVAVQGKRVHFWLPTVCLHVHQNMMYEILIPKINRSCIFILSTKL